LIFHAGEGRPLTVVDAGSEHNGKGRQHKVGECQQRSGHDVVASWAN